MDWPDGREEVTLSRSITSYHYVVTGTDLKRIEDRLRFVEREEGEEDELTDYLYLILKTELLRRVFTHLKGSTAVWSR